MRTSTIAFGMALAIALAGPAAPSRGADAIAAAVPSPVPVAARPRPAVPRLPPDVRTPQPAPAPAENGGEVVGSGPVGFLRGDANGDGVVEMSDSIAILGCQFAGARCPECLDAADVNDDNSVDLSDALWGLNFLFRGDAPPPLPYPFCGIDMTPSRLGCRSYSVCGDGSKVRDTSWRKTVPAALEDVVFDGWDAFKHIPKLLEIPDLVFVHISPSTYAHRLTTSDDVGYPSQFLGVNGNRPVWSRHGRIAFDGSGDIWVVNHDGSGVKNLTIDGSLTHDREPSWSPDGQKIVFNRDNDLHVLHLDGSMNPVSLVKLTNATATGARDYEPAWSPDGARIAFVRAEASSSDFDVYFVNADGSGLARVTNTSEQDRSPAWHPNGRGIVFSRRKSDGDHDLHVILFHGAFQFPMQITSDPNRSDKDPSFSPDGSEIVFARKRNSDTWLHNIHKIKLNGTGLQALTWLSYDAAGNQALWPHWRW